MLASAGIRVSLGNIAEPLGNSRGRTALGGRENQDFLKILYHAESILSNGGTPQNPAKGTRDKRYGGEYVGVSELNLPGGP